MVVFPPLFRCFTYIMSPDPSPHLARQGALFPFSKGEKPSLLEFKVTQLVNSRTWLHFSGVYYQFQRKWKPYHEGVRDGGRTEWKSGTEGLHLRPGKLDAGPDSAPLCCDGKEVAGCIWIHPKRESFELDSIPLSVFWLKFCDSSCLSYHTGHRLLSTYPESSILLAGLIAPSLHVHWHFANCWPVCVL